MFVEPLRILYVKRAPKFVPRHFQIFSTHNKPAHLNHFPDAVNTIGQQALHAPVIIHVISMPDAHEQDVRGESWDSVRHRLGIHISDEALDNLVFIFH